MALVRRERGEICFYSICSLDEICGLFWEALVVKFIPSLRSSRKLRVQRKSANGAVMNTTTYIEYFKSAASQWIIATVLEILAVGIGT